MIQVVDDLVRALAKLPGMGSRSAERAALFLLRNPNGVRQTLMDALQQAADEVRCCHMCGSFTTADRIPCALCSDTSRDQTMLCVVEEPGDILIMERSGAFKGRYHALLGKLSPAKRTGAAELRINELLMRIDNEKPSEVLLALSTDIEGDATASFLSECLRNKNIKVTRLAFGLPADSGVRYSDPLTLRRAIMGRVSAE